LAHLFFNASLVNCGFRLVISPDALAQQTQAGSLDCTVVFSVPNIQPAAGSCSIQPTLDMLSLLLYFNLSDALISGAKTILLSFDISFSFLQPGPDAYNGIFLGAGIIQTAYPMGIS
jgi:hypothetical protein